MNKKRWTKEEDELLVNTIKESSFNLSEAFNKVSSELGRTTRAICYRWYCVLNNPEHPKYAGTCFTLISSARELRNGKTTSKNIKPVPLRPTIWNRIKKLLKLN